MVVEQQRQTPATREVVCTHCERKIEIPATAMSVSCRHCHRRVIIEDLEIKSYHAVMRIATAGKVEVLKKGTLVADVRVNELAVEGNLKGNVVALERVAVGKKATLEGDVCCTKLSVEPGAKLKGHFRVDPKFVPQPRASADDEDAGIE